MNVSNSVLSKISRRLQYFFFRSFFPAKKDGVYVAGWIGSGSTFIYQVLRELQVPVYKVHSLPRFHSFNLTFFTIRDPRDVVLSTALRHFSEIANSEGIKPALLKAINHFADKHQSAKEYFSARNVPNLIFIRYETFFLQNEELLIQFLADQIACPVNDRRIKEILKRTSMEANIKRMRSKKDFDEYDPASMIHGKHISNKGKIGGWLDVFDHEVAKVFHNALGDLLISLKYEESANWVKKVI